MNDVLGKSDMCCNKMAAMGYLKSNDKIILQALLVTLAMKPSLLYSFPDITAGIFSWLGLTAGYFLELSIEIYL